MTALSRIVAFVGIVIGLVGLGLDFYEIIPSSLAANAEHPRSLLDALIYFWTYFTHLSNLGIGLCYLAALLPGRWLNWFRTPIGRAAWGANIALVMVFFHFMLAPYYHFEGILLVANVLLHYVAPSLYLLWWLFLTPHGTLRFADIPVLLIPGFIYLAWAMLRGAVVGEYPYSILDAKSYGYGQVAIGAGTVIIAVAVFCVILVALDKLLGRARATRRLA